MQAAEHKLWADLTHCSDVFIAVFEQVNAGLIRSKHTHWLWCDFCHIFLYFLVRLGLWNYPHGVTKVDQFLCILSQFFCHLIDFHCLKVKNETFTKQIKVIFTYFSTMCTLRCLINGWGTLINFSIFFPPLRLLIFKEWWSTKFFSVAKWVFSFM